MIVNEIKFSLSMYILTWLILSDMKYLVVPITCNLAFDPILIIINIIFLKKKI